MPQRNILRTLAVIFFAFSFFSLGFILGKNDLEEEKRTKKELSSPTPTVTVSAQPSPSLTEPEIFYQQQKENMQEVVVTKVIDGDTIEVNGEYKVRYIGIDTPELQGDECLAQQAKNFNEELVGGKKVWLEKDVSETDKYGRLLRYIWSGELLINEYLVQEGYATVTTFPPDVKYQDRFLKAQQEARENNKGLWNLDSECP